MTLLVLSRPSFSRLQILLQFRCWKICTTITNRIEKDRDLFCLLFFQSRQGGDSKVLELCPQILCSLWGGRKQELVTVNQQAQLNPIHREINQVTSPRSQRTIFTMITVLIIFSKFQNIKPNDWKLVGPHVGGCWSFGPLASSDLNMIIS